MEFISELVDCLCQGAFVEDLLHQWSEMLKKTQKEMSKLCMVEVWVEVQLEEEKRQAWPMS